MSETEFEGEPDVEPDVEADVVPDGEETPRAADEPEPEGQASAWTPDPNEWDAVVNFVQTQAQQQQWAQQQALQAQAGSEQEQLEQLLEQAMLEGDSRTVLAVTREISRREAQAAVAPYQQLAEHDHLRQVQEQFDSLVTSTPQAAKTVEAIDAASGEPGQGKQMLLHLAASFETSGLPMDQAVRQATKQLAGLIGSARGQAARDLQEWGDEQAGVNDLGVAGGATHLLSKPKTYDEVLARHGAAVNDKF